jgi:hypothetical protein
LEPETTVFETPSVNESPRVSVTEEGVKRPPVRLPKDVEGITLPGGYALILLQRTTLLPLPIFEAPT